TLDFALDQIIGSRSNPQIIAAEALTRLEYIVNDGWNWLSFPLASTSLNNVNTVFRDLSPAVEDLFRSVDPFTTYNPGGAWMGALTQLNTNEGYKLKITGQDTFYYEGRFNDPLNEPITVRPGWNWIGVKSEFIIDIESALASLDPQTGDLIKGQRSFAIYEDGFGWGGNLEFLIPQVGYMLKYHKADDLIFPSNLNALSKEPLLSQRKSNTDEERYYDVAGFVPGQYSTTMSLTAALGSCPILSTIDPTQWVLGAYAGGVCRGVAASTYVSANAAYVYYLSVEGSADEELQFRLVHKFDGRQITLSEGMDYQGDQVLGRTSEPYLFTCASLVDCVASRHYRSSDIISGSQMQIERAQIRLQSDAILPSTGSFRFMAGESVDLLHGFEVSSGALLEIIIQNCQNSQE
ncbi:MAG: 3-coathanger stack domain-containing protein, partial [Bacteroidota bacterium]